MLDFSIGAGFHFFPNFLKATVFAMYVYMGNEIDIAKILTVISLLNIANVMPLLLMLC